MGSGKEIERQYFDCLEGIIQAASSISTEMTTVQIDSYKPHARAIITTFGGSILALLGAGSISAMLQAASEITRTSATSPAATI